jgi:hypothetical protein
MQAHHVQAWQQTEIFNAVEQDCTAVGSYSSVSSLTEHNSGQAMCNGRVTAQYSITTMFLANTCGNTH